MKLAIVILSVVFTAALAGASAQDARADGHYGAAGCGLGSIIFGSQPGFVQVLAATTNGSFGSQTFGITFGTSNCSASGEGMISTRSFVESNREVLAKDIARGSGETIATLTTLAGCADSGQVGVTLQQRFGDIFPSTAASDRDVSQNVVTVLQGQRELSCSAL
ncbi:MAG: hypothetical protein Tsb0020_07820 [Haliangiales bacterium]